MIKNVIKGMITSSIGVITMLVTLFLVFVGSIDFIWSGLAGLSFGTILLLSPDTIIQKIGDVITLIGLKKGSDKKD